MACVVPSSGATRPGAFSVGRARPGIRPETDARFGRRGMLIGMLGVVATACSRVAPRSAQPDVTAGPEFDAWAQEARGMLSDALQALRTFESFHAFRVSTAATSDLRLASELAWDPPTSAAWDEATHNARGLRGRAEQLFLSVTNAQIAPGLWREQRAAADRAHDLLGLGDALATYRDRIDRLGVGDASGALDPLDRLWQQWETSAARWGVGRFEPLGCQA